MRFLMTHDVVSAATAPPGFVVLEIGVGQQIDQHLFQARVVRFKQNR